jgi:hypothetical protein
MLLDVRAKLDLLDVDRLLLLARFAFLFLGFVFELAVIEDLTDGRIDVTRDLDKVESRVRRLGYRVPCGNDTELLSVFVD